MLITDTRLQAFIFNHICGLLAAATIAKEQASANLAALDTPPCDDPGIVAARRQLLLRRVIKAKDVWAGATLAAAAADDNTMSSLIYQSDSYKRQSKN